MADEDAKPQLHVLRLDGGEPGSQDTRDRPDRDGERQDPDREPSLHHGVEQEGGPLHQRIGDREPDRSLPQDEWCAQDPGGHGPEHGETQHEARLTETSFSEAVRAHPVIQKHLSEKEIEDCVEPRAYLGRTQAIVSRVLARHRRSLRRKA